MAIDYLRSIRGKKVALKKVIGPQLPERISSIGGPVQAATVIELLPVPAALWSTDRRACLFNEPTRKLLGFAEHDFEKSTHLWLDRIHPHDRQCFIDAWTQLQQQEKKISCRYRFLPRNRGQEIHMQEFSCCSSSGSVAGTVIWSFYAEDSSVDKEIGEIRQIRELLVGLAHELGNSLQAITGELDLLRLAGNLPKESSATVNRSVGHIRKLTGEVAEFLSPPALKKESEDLTIILNEVIRASECRLAEHGIQMAVAVKGPLPDLPLDGQFRSALAKLIEFSCALLPQGGKLTIEAEVQRLDDSDYVKLSLINASPTELSIEGSDIFRPFLKVNDHRVGLSMTVARQILRRHFGKIVFNQARNQGVFSILIKIPSET